MDGIGLFPLGVVLLPDERLPLHIFEDRYKELIGECLDSGQPFGLVLSDDDGMREIGTRAAVSEVLEHLPDGRLNILVEGRERFRVVRVTEGRSFVTAEVEDYPDERDEVPEADEVAACLDGFRRLVEAAEADPPDLTQSGATQAPLAFRIAGMVDFEAEVKQELLEMRSERARVRRLTDVMDEAIDVVLLRRRIQKRAAGNGHVGES